MTSRNDRDTLADEVGAQAARKLRARDGRGVWSGFGMFGLIGWSVALPTLLGAGLGMWLDSRTPGLNRWTLTLLVAGLVIGCCNAWAWVAKEDRAMREGSDDDHA